MYLPENASRARIREAENARNNRLEIVRALSTGQVTRRELLKWGIFTAAGALAPINGLSPFAGSAYAASIPTGSTRSPLFGAKAFTQALPRLSLQEPIPLIREERGNEVDVRFDPNFSSETLPGRRLSYHTGFAEGITHTNPGAPGGPPVGPIEGRPPGEYFAHQRWEEYLPKKGYVMTLGQIAANSRFHPNFAAQDPNRVWTFATGRNARGTLPPPLIKVRYGEPVLFRHYNALPSANADNEGFGSVSQATHNHNMHNASTSDGASNAHFFRGQFFDYHWATCLARADAANNPLPARASGPDDGDGRVPVPGDFRELQGTLWFHDHRFFFTAENVYKGHLGMLNMYSGPDRGREDLNDGINLRLPSGTRLPWGNIDFDVNLIISDAATKLDGQLYFDIFDTDGFLGDLLLVNFAYKPVMEVLPRKYRFRILCGSMSRFVKLALLNPQGVVKPVDVIANDGNLLYQPITVNQLDILATAERFDIIVDFGDPNFRIGDTLRLINTLQFKDGRGPDQQLSVAAALRGSQYDPAVGDVMQFKIVRQVESVDDPGHIYDVDEPGTGWQYAGAVPLFLTERIDRVVDPTRTRHIEFKRAGPENTGLTGPCFPDCGDDKEFFPWAARINGESTHFLNANRVSLVVPKPGDVEHWVLKNGSDGWSHPIHLHFEEGVTLDRGNKAVPAIEYLARKDVWRLGPRDQVRIQVKFGEFGGAYVMHCHNTVHEDNAMLMRYDILTDPNNPDNSQTHTVIIPTPNPTPQGVTYVKPTILPEGHKGFPKPAIGPTTI